jgi:hypothetical protein
MPKYNIIYTSPQKDPYLWDGTSLTKLEKAEQGMLRFSGKSFKKEELDDATADCKKAVKQSFPKDENPEIKSVQITVSD